MERRQAQHWNTSQLVMKPVFPVPKSLFFPLYQCLESHGLLSSRGSKGFQWKGQEASILSNKEQGILRGHGPGNTAQPCQCFCSPSEGQNTWCSDYWPTDEPTHLWSTATQSVVQRDLEHKPPFAQTYAFWIQNSNHFKTAEFHWLWNQLVRKSKAVSQKEVINLLLIYDCVLGYTLLKSPNLPPPTLCCLKLLVLKHYSQRRSSVSRCQLCSRPPVCPMPRLRMIGKDKIN